MRKQVLLAISTLVFFMGNAQMSRPTGSGVSFYFNSFQYFTNADVDSATAVDSGYYYVQKLASDPKFESSLQNLIHQAFAQSFIPVQDNEKSEKYIQRTNIAIMILKKMMADSNALLVRTVRPVYYWWKAQQKPRQLKQVIKEFTDTELNEPNYRNNYRARYALLLCKMADAQEALKAEASALFARVMDSVKKNQVLDLSDSASYVIRDKRTWYRYMYAYCNHVLAKKASANNKVDEAGKYYRFGYDYSPDLIDKNNASSYFYDMIFLFGEENNIFRDDYLKYIMAHSTSKEAARDIMMDMAAKDPEMKQQLREYYEQHFKGQGSFSSYWMKSLARGWKQAPAYSLRMMNGKKFSLIDYRGKWLLIDFWGTWCGPCRKEHPGMNRFSKEIDSLYRDKISLMTVACRDSEEAVRSYMSKNGYQFPVLMSDGKIETTFPVQGYPTKILVNPEGKYTIIPFGVSDWVNFVKQYVDL